MIARPEILNQRIGDDELAVIEVYRTDLGAQPQDAALRAQSGLEPVYAQHYMSYPGTHDGLYWPIQPGERQSPRV